MKNDSVAIDFKQKILSFFKNHKLVFIDTISAIVLMILYAVALRCYALSIFNLCGFIFFLLLIVLLVVLEIYFAHGLQALTSKKTIAIFFVIAILSIYSLFTFNKTFPISEGWYTNFANMILSGKKPYIDFELLFPPIYTYFISFLAFSFGTNLLVLRIVGVFMFLIEGLLLYKIFEFSKNEIFSAFVAVSSAIMLRSSLVSSICYDYSDFYIIFNFLFIYFFLRFILRKKEDQLRVFSIFNLNLLFSSIFLVFSIFSRQSSGVLNMIFSICLLLFILLINKKDEVKLSLLSFFAGLLFTSFIIVIIMLCQGIFVPFIKTMFLSPQGKGGIIQILFGWIPNTFNNIYVILNFVVIAIVSFVFFIVRARKAKILRNKLYEKLMILSVFILFFIGSIIFLSLEISSFINNIYAVFMLFTFIFSFLAFASFAIYQLIQKIKYDVTISYESCFIISLTGFAVFTQFGACTSGGLSELHAALTLGATFLVIYFLFKEKSYIMSRFVPVASAFIFTMSSLSKINVISYDWWGLTQGSYVSQTETIDIPILNGIKVDKKTKSIIESIVSDVTQLKKDGDSLYCFMQIPVFYTLCDIAPLNEIFSIVPWFDVSIQENVSNDFKVITDTHKPTFIIYCRPPEYVIKSHEMSFNNGERYVQRDFFDYFRKCENTGVYRVLEEFNLAKGNDSYYPIKLLELSK